MFLWLQPRERKLASQDSAFCGRGRQEVYRGLGDPGSSQSLPPAFPGGEAPHARFLRLVWTLLLGGHGGQFSYFIGCFSLGLTLYDAQPGGSWTRAPRLRALVPGAPAISPRWGLWRSSSRHSLPPWLHRGWLHRTLGLGGDRSLGSAVRRAGSAPPCRLRGALAADSGGRLLLL